MSYIKPSWRQVMASHSLIGPISKADHRPQIKSKCYSVLLETNVAQQNCGGACDQYNYTGMDNLFVHQLLRLYLCVPGGLCPGYTGISARRRYQRG